jgi:hypothetical protein
VQPFAGQVAEAALDHVQPGRRGRREVDVKARLTLVVFDRDSLVNAFSASALSMIFGAMRSFVLLSHVSQLRQDA